jgi:hypothetical protein
MTFIPTIIVSVIIATALSIIYLSRYSIDIDDNSSLMRFTPLVILSIWFTTGITSYSLLEFDRFILDFSDIYEALQNHGFIVFSLKAFVACTAICIAWHRSKVVDYQNKVTSASNDISNFYSIKEHFFDLLTKYENEKIKSFSYIPEKYQNKLFFRLFENPHKSNYTINSNFKTHFKIITDVINQAYIDIYACNIDESLGYSNAIEAINTQLIYLGIETEHMMNTDQEIFSIRIMNRLMILSDLEIAINSLPIQKKFKEEFKTFRDDIDSQIGCSASVFQTKITQDLLTEQATQ